MGLNCLDSVFGNPYIRFRNTPNSDSQCPQSGEAIYRAAVLDAITDTSAKASPVQKGFIQGFVVEAGMISAWGENREFFVGLGSNFSNIFFGGS